jgi:hypothetical protein
VCLQWCLWQACQISIACCCVWSSRATPCNSMDHCQENNLHPIMQHARCHACLLIISISEASKVNHVKAYAATWLYLPAITHCPPKCIMHHTQHTLIAICVHSALSKHNAVSTRQECITVLHCWMLLHAMEYSLHTTVSYTQHHCQPVLDTRAALPCLAPVHAPSTAIHGGPCFTTTAPGERWS